MSISGSINSFNAWNLIYEKCSRDTGALERQRAARRHHNGSNHPEQRQPLGQEKQRNETGSIRTENIQGSPKGPRIETSEEGGPPWLVLVPSELWGEAPQSCKPRPSVLKGCTNFTLGTWQYGNDHDPAQESTAAKGRKPLVRYSWQNSEEI